MFVKPNDSARAIVVLVAAIINFAGARARSYLPYRRIIVNVERRPKVSRKSRRPCVWLSDNIYIIHALRKRLTDGR